jgi:tetratricopeptide (TPR) repeat protein
MPQTPPSISSPALALVHQGWDHLKHQRPLAARGSWQQALRIEPDLKQALQAIAALEKANDLPLAARVAYRFRHPENPDQRARWQTVLGDADVADLSTASTLFANLAQADPSDAVARYNEALCLAWSGQNHPAVAALDRSLRLDAATHPELAIEAWTIAELLRQGAGAETLADDLRFSLTIPWNPDQTPDLLDLFPEIRRIPAPKTPGEDSFVEPEIELYEWLDGPSVSAAADLINTARTVLATVTIGRRVLRLSSPIQTALEQVEERVVAKLDSNAHRSMRREVTPLPIPFMDADVWAVRLAPETDPDLGLELVRDAVERYYENEWIHRPRQSLDGLSPLAAAARARQGHPIARAQLSAVIQLRQQLGERPTAIRLYQGYPFDRLRRRLGIDLLDPDSVDPDDLSCAAPDHLDQLDLATLDIHRLADAASSAAGLRQDDRTARFVTRLLDSPETPIPIPRFPTLIAASVRQAMARQDIRAAIDTIERSIPWTIRSETNILKIWQAEILARSSQPAAAFKIYSDLLKHDPPNPLLALDAAETMLDNNHIPHAESLLETTIAIAVTQNRPGINHQATRLLEKLND